MIRTRLFAGVAGLVGAFAFSGAVATSTGLVLTSNDCVADYAQHLSAAGRDYFKTGYLSRPGDRRGVRRRHPLPGRDYGYDGAINRGVVVSTAAISEALETVYGASALVKELKAQS